MNIDFSVFKNHDFSIHFGICLICLFMILVAQTFIQGTACVLAVGYLSHRMYTMYVEHINKNK